jgi:hypothetical protein
VLAAVMPSIGIVVSWGLCVTEAFESVPRPHFGPYAALAWALIRMSFCLNHKRMSFGKSNKNNEN